MHAADVAWTENPLAPRPAIGPPRFVPEDAPLRLDELDEVLRRKLVTPWFQPVVHTGTGRVAAVEALARVIHPATGQVLLPAQFLALAECTGRVRGFDRQVAATAIAQVATWREDPLLAELMVAINVSVDHLDGPELSAFLSRRCSLAGLPTQALIVEITETLQSVTGRNHEDVVERLREEGLQVALDDFGTGSTALSYLLRFPVTAIKINRSFTSALAGQRGQDLVHGILSTALRMGLCVVAEGVEVPEQSEWLTAHGCPFPESLAISRPVPSADLPALVAQLNSRNLITASSTGRET